MAVIYATDVYKKFRVFRDKAQSLKEKILFKSRNHYEDHWVLRGINFEVARGEVLGLIGENGCGKSTLLKLMSKILYPDKGSISMNGRVSSLIELGAGFHPDMSGRENIYTNASIFGLTRHEIQSRLNDIIAFSELGSFIDNPVRTYSSGMYMRLAFSVAINVDADILLIDEILAVGDANFQSKCFDHLRELKASGTTIVLVTHSMGTIESFCNKAIWINNGAIQVEGAPIYVVDKYMQFMNQKKQATIEEVAASEKIMVSNTDDKQATEANNDASQSMAVIESSGIGSKEAIITNVIIKDKDGKETITLKTNDAAEIIIEYKVHQKSDDFVFGVGFFNIDGIRVMGVNTQLDRVKVPCADDNGCVRFKINRIPLLPGKYSLDVAITSIDERSIDFHRHYLDFYMFSDIKSVGVTDIDHEWIV